MARIRTIKPEFFTSDDICSLSPLARLLYIGLWCEADRAGRMVWAPKAFRRRYLPDDRCDIESLCAELTKRGLVVLYGEGFAVIPAFAEHQHLNPREAESKLPEPDASLTREPRVTDATVTGREEGKGREGKERVASRDTSADPSLTDQLIALPLPDGLKAESWEAWVRHRQRQPKGKRIGSVEQASAQLKQLAGWIADGHDAGKIIAASLAAGWQGLFPKPETLAVQRSNVTQFRSQQEPVSQARKPLT